jgi:VCBS repeat-containing protein
VLTVTAASAPAGQGSASVVGNQVRFNPGSDFDYLAVGESAVVTVSYSITDEHGATSSSTVQVTVTGTNDAPTIDAAGTTATGSVTELPNGDPGEGIAVHEAGGTIAFDDLDLSDTHSASATAQGSGYYGTFTLDPVNQSGDSVGWHFDVDDAEIDGLEEGEVVTQTYTVTIDDGHGGTTTQDVTITITGAADSVPPDGTNWYIDNSAVGSANTGSPTDPFTSIAAFNAAQGTAGGPGVNDNVFLLAGTGTGLYAEADGINLLDGQVLTGVATGSVRPTITATAGDGIDVAENNTISGIDIGSTSGAGIDDDGGTVGTLTVSDVAKSGSGQVVDIDNGGTLNVTLNSASSTGSTGGAIDLNLVGGSFTIAGATTITGVHSGGGIDVTGSSATVTLAGGGLVSTGANTAISFTGNAGGTLAITGGGFDIATTSGSGLVGSGGGTIIITGAGNNVATGSGGAIFVDGTAIGAAGLTLESVSANPGTATGIYLRNTGTAGGLEVTGTGVAGSGGTIDGRTGADLSTTTGIGVYLENTSHVSLTGMLLQNFTNFAIRGVNVNNFSLVDSIVTNTAGFNGTNAASEGSISFTGLTGDAVFDGVLVERGLRDNLGITNSTGHLDLSVIDSSFLNTSTASGQNGIGITLSGTASLNALITGSTFSGNRINNLLVNNNGSGNARVQIGLDGEAGSGGTWSNSGTGINLNHNGTGSFNFDILNATISNAAGQSSPVNINMLTGARGPLTGNIVDNLITNHAASTGPAVRVISNGTDSVVPIENTLTVLIEGNTIINNAANIGISVIARNGNSTLNATIHDNVITNTSTSGLAHGIEARAGAASADLVQLNLDISDNVIALDPAAALAGAFGIRLFRITATTNAVARLEDYTGGTTDTAAIHAFLSGENNGASVLATVNTVNGAGWGFIDDVPMPPAPLYDVPLIP